MCECLCVCVRESERVREREREMDRDVSVVRGEKGPFFFLFSLIFVSPCALSVFVFFLLSTFVPEALCLCLCLSRQPVSSPAWTC